MGIEVLTSISKVKFINKMDFLDANQGPTQIATERMQQNNIRIIGIDRLSM